MNSATIDIEITNELGLHARPAAAFVRTVSKFNSDVLVEKDGEAVNGKSLVGILMLAAGHKTTVRITVTGPDSAEAISAIRTLTRYDKDFTEG